MAHSLFYLKLINIDWAINNIGNMLGDSFERGRDDDRRVSIGERPVREVDLNSIGIEKEESVLARE